MKVIILESTVYQITEVQFKQLKKVENDHPKNDMKLYDYLEQNKSKYKLVGDVNFDFRL